MERGVLSRTLMLLQVLPASSVERLGVARKLLLALFLALLHGLGFRVSISSCGSEAVCAGSFDESTGGSAGRSLSAGGFRGVHESAAGIMASDIESRSVAGAWAMEEEEEEES